MTKQVIYTLLGLILAVGAVAAMNIPAFALPAAICAVLCFWQMFKLEAADRSAVDREIQSTDKQLRSEIIDAQKLAFKKLADADEAFTTQVAELIADAAMHLGYPDLSGRFPHSPDYTLNWNKQPPGPELPADVARKTGEKYQDAYRALTGREL